MRRLFFLLALLLASTTQADDAALEGDYLYRVMTVRAAPGHLSDYLDWLLQFRASGYFEEAGVEQPMIMRHSQGDHWDLMIIRPMRSWAAFHSEAATERREAAQESHRELLMQARPLLAFSEDHFAVGPPLDDVRAAFESNRFYHIEMFEAVAGKAEELTEQRRMENRYLSETGQITNMIFRRAAGSDVDVFTIGFHPSLEAFAAPSSATDDDKEAAAVAAGFKDRSDISFYLRSLISGHHDTLAVKVD